MDSLFVRRYDSSWLHFSLLIEGSFRFTTGYNIGLPSGAIHNPTIIAHELVHTYNSRLSPTLPTFLIEGLPDIIAVILTGSALFEGFATFRKVSLAFDNRDPISPVLEESGNGLLLFKALLAEMGRDNFEAGVQSAFSMHWNITALEFLHALKESAPRRNHVEDIYRAWIADYIPDSA